MRGDGRLFLRGHRWRLAFYKDGKEMRESTGTDDAKQAEKYQQRRLKELAAHELADKPFLTASDRRRTSATCWTHCRLITLPATWPASKPSVLSESSDDTLAIGRGWPSAQGAGRFHRPAAGRRLLESYLQSLDRNAETRLQPGRTARDGISDLVGRIGQHANGILLTA
jgi:hypothetical protein